METAEKTDSGQRFRQTVRLLFFGDIKELVELTSRLLSYEFGFVVKVEEIVGAAGHFGSFVGAYDSDHLWLS